MKIKRVDTEKHLIDYVLVIDGVSQESKRAPRQRRRSNHHKKPKK